MARGTGQKVSGFSLVGGGALTGQRQPTLIEALVQFRVDVSIFPYLLTTQGFTAWYLFHCVVLTLRVLRQAGQVSTESHTQL